MHTQATLETVPVLGSAPAGGHSRRRARINTKLRSHGSSYFEETVDTTKDTFFDRNFPGETEVPWFKFQQGFLSDYEAQLTGRGPLLSFLTFSSAVLLACIYSSIVSMV